MKVFTKRQVQSHVADLAKYIDSVDTPKEVRATVGYTFLLGMTDRLVVLGLDRRLASRAAAAIKVDLPPSFHIDFPEEFVELIRLYSKSTFAVWKTTLVDFGDDYYEEIFLALISTSQITMT